jgi:hypothetical protein
MSCFARKKLDNFLRLTHIASNQSTTPFLTSTILRLALPALLLAFIYYSLYHLLSGDEILDPSELEQLALLSSSDNEI